jgi:hypothetical protein
VLTHQCNHTGRLLNWEIGYFRINGTGEQCPWSSAATIGAASVRSTSIEAPLGGDATVSERAMTLANASGIPGRGCTLPALPIRWGPIKIRRAGATSTAPQSQMMSTLPFLRLRKLAQQMAGGSVAIRT